MSHKNNQTLFSWFEKKEIEADTSNIVKQS